MNSPIRAFGVGMLAHLAIACCVLAGPLDPPAGPIASTPGPEPRIAINATNTPGDADSLYRISQPGSYYLTGNVTGVAAKSGIEIASSRVTVDLNGFTLTGVAGSLAGIRGDTTSRNYLHIHNGNISSWDGDGVDVGTTLGSSNIIVENLRVNGNGGHGIAASEAIVRNCFSSLNTLNGVASAAVIIGCVARDNGQAGLQCTNGGTIVDCSAFENGANGLYAGNGSNISNSTAKNNGGTGIILFGDGVISGCSATLNADHGINGQAGTMIIDCNSGDNEADGIVVLDRSVVRGCTCSGNVSDGIFVSSGSGNRIEGNNMTFNGRGLSCIGAGNVIVRNSCSGNTIVNWSIAANNVVGPILNRTAPASASISGDSAPSSLGSTDANANYTY